MIYYFIFITNIIFFILGGYVGYRVHEWQHREIDGEVKPDVKPEVKPTARPKAKANKREAERLRRDIKNMLTYDGTDQTNKDV